MTNMDILDAIGGLDGDMVSELDRLRDAKRPGKRVHMRYAALAASLALAVGLGALALGRPIVDTPSPAGPGEPAVLDPGGTGDMQDPSVDPASPEDTTPPEGTAEAPTSDTYATLEELLKYLSRHEVDSDTDQKGGVMVSGSPDGGADTGSAALARDGYVYYVNDSSLCAAPITGGAGETVETDFEVERLFLLPVREGAPGLAVLGYDGEPDDRWVRVELYDISSPGAPVPVHTVRQEGMLSAAYLEGGDSPVLTLITAGGECACGWRPARGAGDYIPDITLDGEIYAREEHTLSVLGEPTRASWAAVTVIDTAGSGTGLVSEARVLYGNVDGVYSGSGALAVSCDGGAGTELYLFTDLTFRGRLAGETLGGGELANLSMSWRDGELRLLGQTGSGDVLALSCTPDAGPDAAPYVLDMSAREEPKITDVLWEEDRAVFTVQITDAETRDRTDLMLLASYGSGGVSAGFTGITLSPVNGIDGVVWSPNPMGSIDSIVPIGGGRYLRYTSGPLGFDVLEPDGGGRVVARDAVKLPEERRLTFTRALYGDGTMGVLVISPAPDGRYNRPAFSWQIYSLESLELLAEYGLGEASAFTGCMTPFDWDGGHYVMTPSGCVKVG